MANRIITIMPDNVKATVAEGTSLMHAAREAGVEITGTCGGRGTCGKCAVRLLDGEVEAGDAASLSRELREEGYVLSCRARVKGDATIEIPGLSRLTELKVELAGKEGGSVGSSRYLESNKMDPVCRKLYLKLDGPAPDDPLNDLDRLKLGLLRTYGIEGANISLDCLRRLPTAARQGDWEVTLTLAGLKGADGIDDRIVVEGNIYDDIINIEAGRSDKPAYGIAVDIGTTTVAASLVDTGSGKILDSAGTYNRQAEYGSDVISRIIYSEEHQKGPELLQKAVVDTINSLAAVLLKKHGLDPMDISAMVCAGNTVMSHLLMKIPTAYLRLEPYVPCATKYPVVKARELSLGINPDAPVVTLPSVASYVGGDITAGVLALMLNRSEKLTLFMDVGTNGELVLGSSEWAVTCSCSAGPAFEGSGISSGMRAMDGAIDWVDIDRDTLEARVRVMGGGRPLGICGSGLIYAISELQKAGIIDRAGKIRSGRASRRIRNDGDNGARYILAFGEDSGGGKEIAITESDVKNLLRAKAAMFAGIRTMLGEVDLGLEDIERVCIAGGFGSYINIPDAINIGMLPDLPGDRYEYVGNSSIQGAVTVLLCREALKEAEDITGWMTNIELSVGSRFMEEFISALFIPHTDMSLFAGRKG